MKTLSVWIQASRPKTLIASISPVAIASAMAMSKGLFSIFSFCFLLLTALGIQITTNYANDWLDFAKGADRKERKGPLRVTQQGLVTVQEIKRMTMIVLCLTVLASIPLIGQGGPLFVGLIALSLLLAIGYTGGPLPLAYVGLGDLFVLIFFGPVATCASYFIYTRNLSWQVFLAGLCPGLLSCAILSINNLRDEAEDRKSRKKTLVVRLGKDFGKWQTCACLLIPPFIPALIGKGHPFAFLTLLCLIPALPLCKSIYKVEKPLEYNPLFSKTGKLLALYTFTFCIAWML